MKAQLLLLLTMLSLTVYAQDQSQAFDFWVGTWEVKWQGGSGINTITKTVDDKVLQENFEITDGQNTGFKGTSISVYNPKSGLWHQAWADNNGGYYNFIGEIGEGKRIFKTLPIEKDGKTYIQRMAFKNIKEDGFNWYWEGSQDGGNTWNLLWEIAYSRL